MRNIRKGLGLEVRRRRIKLEMSQEILAEIADIHRTYISSIELGKVTVGIDVAHKIAKALKMPLSKLIQQVERNLP